MNAGRFKTIARYAGVFLAGLLVGALAVDVVAARSMEAHVLHVKSRLHGELSLRSQRARCEGDWLSAAQHSWATQSTRPLGRWKSLEIQPQDGSLLAPLLGWVLHDLHEQQLALARKSSFPDGVELAEYARALEHLDLPEAEAVWVAASKKSGLSVPELKALEKESKACDAEYLQILERALDVVTTGEAPPN